MSAKALTGKQLLAHTLQGLPTPRVATGPLAVHYCARLNGVSLREYSTSPRILAESVIRYYERFRPDAVWLSADTWVSAEAMGAKVGAGDDDQPLGGFGPPLIETVADLERVPRPDPGSQGRYPLMLAALERIVAALGQDAAIVACFDQYPFSLAAALLGLNNIMLKLVDDPPLVEAVMERCLEYGLAYGRALAASGADLLSGGDAPAGLIGPRQYRAVALPFERRLTGALKAATGKPVSLHICGDSRPILADMAQSGAGVLEIDHLVDISQACRLVKSEVALWGNVNPVGVLAQGSVTQVRQATQELLAAMAACGRRRFVLSSGCTLAVETPAENLEAMLHMALDEVREANVL